MRTQWHLCLPQHVRKDDNPPAQCLLFLPCTHTRALQGSLQKSAKKKQDTVQQRSYDAPTSRLISLSVNALARKKSRNSSTTSRTLRSSSTFSSPGEEDAVSSPPTTPREQEAGAMGGSERAKQHAAASSRLSGSQGPEVTQPTDEPYQGRIYKNKYLCVFSW